MTSRLHLQREPGLNPASALVDPLLMTQSLLLGGMNPLLMDVRGGDRDRGRCGAIVCARLNTALPARPCVVLVAIVGERSA
jgi:hypothetical protein